MIDPPPPLTDGQVHLRLWKAGDEAALSAAWDDPEIQRWTHVPDATGVRAAELWIDGCERRARAGLAIDLAVLHQSGDVIGEVGLHGFDRRRRAAEIGYWVLASERGTGVAVGAVRLVCEWSLAPGRLNAIVGRCDPRNEASVAVVRRAGFDRIGTHEDMAVYARRLVPVGPADGDRAAVAPRATRRC